MYIKELFATLIVKTKTQAKLLELENKYRIKTVILGKKVAVLVWLNYDNEQQNDEAKSNFYAQCYIIQSEALFKQTKAKQNLIFDSSATKY